MAHPLPVGGRATRGHGEVTETFASWSHASVVAAEIEESGLKGLAEVGGQV
jgi:hypothetical protein